MSENNLQGRCLCGAVTVRATAVDHPPVGHGLGACHCGMCRRWTSSTFIEVSAARTSVEATGPVQTYKSSDWAERAFCGTCGSALWYLLTGEGMEAEPCQLSAGLFDNAADRDLTLEVYIDKKPAGYAFAGKRATMTEADILKMVGDDPEADA
ncbi:MAG: GFA family protein [Alphaproteobacteria bacterium]|nr:GFA family protein [Alphaproteobacteria bacterium]NNF23690.1 GFA family protein [Paracoccaceae bacterium]